MIVCVCNNITEGAANEAALKASSFDQMLKLLKYRYECGTCFDTLKAIWDDIN